jgi:hypothetical protein
MKLKNLNQTQSNIPQPAVEHAQKKRASAEPSFATKKVDYSMLRAVRIDQRTIIYAKPGEDVTQVRENYLQRIERTRIANQQRPPHARVY